MCLHGSLGQRKWPPRHRPVVFRVSQCGSIPRRVAFGVLASASLEGSWLLGARARVVAATYLPGPVMRPVVVHSLRQMTVSLDLHWCALVRISVASGRRLLSSWVASLRPAGSLDLLERLRTIVCIVLSNHGRRVLVHDWLQVTLSLDGTLGPGASCVVGWTTLLLLRFGSAPL